MITKLNITITKKKKKHFLDFRLSFLPFYWQNQYKRKINNQNTFKKEKFISLLLILQSNGVEGPLVIRYDVVLTTSAQNAFGNLACNLMLLAHSFRILFILSATLFYWGVPEMVFSILIPFSTQFFLNSTFLYFPPLLDREYFTFKFVWFSTMALHFLKIS